MKIQQDRTRTYTNCRKCSDNWAETRSYLLCPTILAAIQWISCCRGTFMMNLPPNSWDCVDHSCKKAWLPMDTTTFKGLEVEAAWDCTMKRNLTLHSHLTDRPDFEFPKLIVVVYIFLNNSFSHFRIQDLIYFCGTDISSTYECNNIFMHIW